MSSPTPFVYAAAAATESQSYPFADAANRITDGKEPVEVLALGLSHEVTFINNANFPCDPQIHADDGTWGGGSNVRAGSQLTKGVGQSPVYCDIVMSYFDSNKKTIGSVNSTAVLRYMAFNLLTYIRYDPSHSIDELRKRFPLINKVMWTCRAITVASNFDRTILSEWSMPFEIDLPSADIVPSKLLPAVYISDTVNNVKTIYGQIFLENPTFFNNAIPKVLLLYQDTTTNLPIIQQNRGHSVNGISALADGGNLPDGAILNFNDDESDPVAAIAFASQLTNFSVDNGENNLTTKVIMTTSVLRNTPAATTTTVTLGSRGNVDIVLKPTNYSIIQSIYGATYTAVVEARYGHQYTANHINIRAHFLLSRWQQILLEYTNRIGGQGTLSLALYDKTPKSFNYELYELYDVDKKRQIKDYDNIYTDFTGANSPVDFHVEMDREAPATIVLAVKFLSVSGIASGPIFKSIQKKKSTYFVDDHPFFSLSMDKTPAALRFKLDATVTLTSPLYYSQVRRVSITLSGITAPFLLAGGINVDMSQDANIRAHGHAAHYAPGGINFENPASLTYNVFTATILYEIRDGLVYEFIQAVYRFNWSIDGAGVFSYIYSKI